MDNDSNLIKDLENNFIKLHQSQFKSIGLPELYWSNLFNKIRNEIFDAGNYFQLCMRVDEDDQLIGYKAICTAENGLDLNDPDGVFLIDHAWTYKLNEARQTLSDNENLLERMINLMNIKLDDYDEESTVKSLKEFKVDAVIDNMWKFNQTYKISTEKMTDEEREPIWYIMDEFGSSIRHNDEPSVRLMPFCYIPNTTMYSIIWPLKKLNHGDELTRDYAYGVKDEKLRKAKLLPWNEDDDIEDIFADEGDPTVQPEPEMSYFKTGAHDEILPDQDVQIELINLNKLNLNTNNNLINVYTDLSSVKEFLTDKKFTFVDELSKADIVFVRQHYKDFKTLREKSPNTLINQFPSENVVTVKDLLAIVCRRVADWQEWLPITYNLTYELPKFIAYFNQRSQLDLDNYWILKPWNLARSIDTSITNNLNQIIRSQETGPKIACKYISNPVLFHREELNGKVKFDVRYIVLLRSIKPLKIFTYKVFWLRFANKPYGMESFEDYEKHFTVMNYKPSVVLKQINCDEFVPLFEQQNPEHKWANIEQKIFGMIRKVFEGATKEKPPKGIGNNYQSRAMYAIDLMLDWRKGHNEKQTIEPMICEINFMPDCTRACKYHKNFFNDIFNTLFLDIVDHNNVKEI